MAGPDWPMDNKAHADLRYITQYPMQTSGDMAVSVQIVMNQDLIYGVRTHPYDEGFWVVSIRAIVSLFFRSEELEEAVDFFFQKFKKRSIVTVRR